MKIKLKERIPVNSRVQNFNWFITKDYYGNYYIFLIPTQFGEQRVWKLQYRIFCFLETYAEDIEYNRLHELQNPKIIGSNETKFKRIDTTITNYIKDFNHCI